MPALGIFAQWLQARPIGYNQVDAEIHELLDGWRNAFGDPPGMHANEAAAKIDLTAELLRRWFGDAMLQQPMHIADLQRASVVICFASSTTRTTMCLCSLATRLLPLASRRRSAWTW